ncbi:MAG TPA: hypothetical protein VI197_03185 [Polyangiaceae bacterium]
MADERASWVQSIGAALCGVLIGACSGPSPQATSSSGSLKPGIVARVGSQELQAEFVASVAARQGLSITLASERAVAEALLAEAATARFEGSGLLAVSQRSAHARALLDELKVTARRAGPPSDSEIGKLRDERWMDFDRPECVRTAHAVVMVKTDADDVPAKAAAERIAEAVRGVSEPERFWELANAVETGALEKRIEGLPLLTADGRGVFLDPADPRRQRPSRFDPEFASAAHAIAAVGGQSPVVKSPFGYHVILLLERVAPQHYELSRLRGTLAPEIYDQRSGKLLAELLARLERETPVERARNVEELTASVARGP